MAVNRSPVFDDFLRKSSKRLSTNSFRLEVYRAEEICKKFSLRKASLFGTEQNLKHFNRSLTFLLVTDFLGSLFSGSPSS